MGEKLTGEALEAALKERKLPIEGTADEKRAAVAKFDADQAKNATASSNEGGSGDSSTNVTDAAEKGGGTTTLDSHLDAPSVTAPGDGPADTTDPKELASTAVPDKAAAAQAGHGTVNAVVKTGEAPEAPSVPESEQRVETYEQERPDGTVVIVTHNIDTGATSVVEK